MGGGRLNSSAPRWGKASHSEHGGALPGQRGWHQTAALSLGITGIGLLAYSGLCRGMQCQAGAWPEGTHRDQQGPAREDRGVGTCQRRGPSRRGGHRDGAAGGWCVTRSRSRPPCGTQSQRSVEGKRNGWNPVQTDAHRDMAREVGGRETRQLQFRVASDRPKRQGPAEGSSRAGRGSEDSAQR